MKLVLIVCVAGSDLNMCAKMDSTMAIRNACAQPAVVVMTN